MVAKVVKKAKESESETSPKEDEEEDDEFQGMMGSGPANEKPMCSEDDDDGYKESDEEVNNHSF